MDDHSLADSVLPVSDPENGNLSDACDSYGILHDFLCFYFFEAMVCIISGSNYLTIDVPDFRCPAEWSYLTAWADDLFARACRNGELTDWNSICASLVPSTLVGKQKMV